MTYIPWHVSPRIVEAAKKRAESFPKDHKNSILKGGGVVPGYIGHEIVLSTFSKSRDMDTIHFDVDIAGRHVEVKTTQQNYEPKETHHCGVSALNPNQETDFYMWVFLLYGFDNAWIVGYLSRKEFFDKAVLHDKGDKEFGITEFKAPEYNVLVSQTHDPEEVFKW